MTNKLGKSTAVK